MECSLQSRRHDCSLGSRKTIRVSGARRARNRRCSSLRSGKNSSLRSQEHISLRDLRGHCILVDNSVNSLDLRIRLNIALPGPDVVGEIPILSLPIDTSYAIARIASRPASTICPLPLFRQSGIRLRGWVGLADRSVTPYPHLALSTKINFLSLMSTRTVDDPLISFQTTYPLTEDERIASIQMRSTTPPVPA